MRAASEIRDRLNEGLQGIQGVIPPQVDPEHHCTYWFYMLRLDLHQLTCSREEFCRALEAEGIPNRAGYIPRYAICSRCSRSGRLIREAIFRLTAAAFPINLACVQ